MASKILKFADDTKIYHTVYSDEDVGALQSDLCNLVEWSKERQMLFNGDKYKVMHMKFNIKPGNDVQLECESEEKNWYRY